MQVFISEGGYVGMPECGNPMSSGPVVLMVLTIFGQMTLPGRVPDKALGRRPIVLPSCLAGIRRRQPFGPTHALAKP